MTSLPKGAHLLRLGESVERVQTKNNVIDLLGHGDGAEIWRQTIRQGGGFTIAPEDGWDALEFFYVLDGTLSWEGRNPALQLAPGDSVSLREIAEPVRFVASTEVSLLYVCSQPTFHNVSKLGRELMSLAVDIEVKDGNTADHCERIRRLSVATAAKLGLSSKRTMILGYAAFLHDVGKVKVPSEILLKPGKLTPEEWDVMRRHPSFGREMVSETILSEAGVLIEQHHERIDGSGYPYGLRGSAVLIEAQIIAVVDSFDAITSDRPYRKGSSVADALREVRRCTGSHWGDEVVQAFMLAVSEEARNIS